MALRRTKTKSSATASPHDVYAITCSCGEFLSGERDRYPMIVECPHCQESLYVLPRDCYPRPKVLEPKPDELEILEESLDTPELSIQEIEDENKRLAEPKDDTPPRIWIDRPRGALVRKRIFQVTGLIVVLLLATWFGISRRAMRTEAEATFFSQSEAAWKLVNEDQWDDARKAAEEAVNAADWLGREDPASEEIRDLHAELAILDQLSSMSLIEIVLEKRAESSDRDKWKSLFSVRYGGRWLLLEGFIVRQVSEEETRYRFDYPIHLQDQQFDLVWDEPVESFEQLQWDGDRCNVFLAVRMEHVQFAENDPEAWSIVLSSDDVRLWTTPFLLTEALGVDLESAEAESLRKLVYSQIPADRFTSTSGKQDAAGNEKTESTTDRLLGEKP